MVYGLNEPVCIELETLQASKLVSQLHGGERMVALRFEKKEGGQKHVLLREVQTTATGNHLLHIDFQEIDTTRTVNVTVEIRTVGVAQGIKLGGILQAVKHEVVVECLPMAIPDFIDVDVSALEIGSSVHVKDITFAEGIKPVTDLEETIIIISAPRVDDDSQTEADEGEQGAAGAEGSG